MTTITSMARDMARQITDKCETAKARDVEVRRIAEVLGCDPIRIAWSSTLRLSCHAVLDEAGRLGRSEADVLAAMGVTRALGERLAAYMASVDRGASVNDAVIAAALGVTEAEVSAAFDEMNRL